MQARHKGLGKVTTSGRTRGGAADLPGADALYIGMTYVLPRLPGCALWLVGDGPARPSLEAMAANGVNGSGPLPVVFWGYQRGEALSAVYTVCDCFVCPSQTETFGQTVNEALASGVPVASMDVLHAS